MFENFLVILQVVMIDRFPTTRYPRPRPLLGAIKEGGKAREACGEESQSGGELQRTPRARVARQLLELATTASNCQLGPLYRELILSDSIPAKVMRIDPL